MNIAYKNRRAIRQELQFKLAQSLNTTKWGQQARPAQIKAGAKLALQGRKVIQFYAPEGTVV